MGFLETLEVENVEEVLLGQERLWGSVAPQPVPLTLQTSG